MHSPVGGSLEPLVTSGHGLELITSHTTGADDVTTKRNGDMPRGSGPLFGDGAGLPSAGEASEVAPGSRVDLAGFVSGGWEEYITRMEKSGEWGDHITLMALANIFQISIWIISSCSKRIQEQQGGKEVKGQALKGATLKGQALKGATLKGQALKGAILKGQALKGATLKGQSFKGIIIVKKKRIQDQQGGKEVKVQTLNGIIIIKSAVRVKESSHDCEEGGFRKANKTVFSDAIRKSQENPFDSAALHPDAFGNLTAVQYLDIAGVTSLSPRVFRHLPCLQTVTFGNCLTCDCEILDLAKWLNTTDVKAERYVTSSQPVACYNPERLKGRPLSNLREEDLQMSCPTTTDPPPTESTMQTCPTSLTTEVMTSPRPVTTPSSTTPTSSSFTTRQPGTCTAPTDVTVQNVQESRAEISWFHDGKSINLDLTGFIIEYQMIFGQKSWTNTQDIHPNGRNFAIFDLLPNTPYQACVAVLCKNAPRKPGLDHCVHFTTKMRSTTIVGLAVGIPLLLVILCLVAAIVIVLKKRGPFSTDQDAGHTPERPQRQEANHSTTGAVGTIEDPPYNSINDNDPQVRPDRENQYQNAGFEEEPGADGITSSYLDFGKAGDVLNSAEARSVSVFKNMCQAHLLTQQKHQSTRRRGPRHENILAARNRMNSNEPHHDAPIPVPRDNRRPCSSSFNNPVYTADSANENIYTRVNDDGLDGAMARSSSAKEDVYIDVIA
ncbi:hypothetical protein Bbelb_393490 [Branchiostoma belcheri]|nr:hypothetical protein Bbelb_393490 [Branchiostoma belcheri]